MKPAGKQILLAMSGLLMLLVLGVAGYWLALLGREAGPVEELPAAADCQPVNEWCHAANGQVDLALRLGGPVRYLAAFPVALRVNGIEPGQIKSVLIEFEMQGMDMGLNRFLLQRVITEDAGKAQPGVAYQGSAVLPVCVSGRVDWLARVSVVTTAGEYRAGFRFSVSHAP